jgi:choline dehydrogenase-like flavoprotein
VNTHFDIVIIGSGAGGGTIAHALAGTPARILLLERGDFVPREAQNWSATEVWKKQRYRARELWRDEKGRTFLPYTHYCVGGNTRFWGSALFRLRREDFQAIQHLDGVSPAWPIDYETLAPYYDRAERLYQVHGQNGLDPTEPPRGPFPFAPIPHSAQMQDIIGALRTQGLHPFPLPLGLIRPGEAGGCLLCATCNSFPCQIGMKGDALACCVDEAIARSNVTLWTNALARRLITDASGARIEGVEVERNGERLQVSASIVIASLRGREFGRAIVAFSDQGAATGSREFFGARRTEIHGASRDDDQRLRSAPSQYDGVSENRGDQRFLPERAVRVSAGTDPIARADRSRDVEERDAVVRQADSDVGVGAMGRQRGGLAGDVGGPADR